MNRYHYFYNPYDKNKKYHPNNQRHGVFQQNKVLFEKNYNPYHKHVNNNYLLPKETNVLMQDEELAKQKFWKRKAKSHTWTKIPKPIKMTNTGIEAHQESTMTVLPPQWCKEDAIRAIEVEQEYNRLQSTQYVLKFPDPVLDKSIIQGFSSGIVNVRVQQPITPRYGIITLNFSPKMSLDFICGQKYSTVVFNDLINDLCPRGGLYRNPSGLYRNRPYFDIVFLKIYDSTKIFQINFIRKPKFK